MENGDYYIDIDVPSEYDITHQDIGDDDTKDSDIDSDGKSCATISNSDNMTIDGGLIKKSYCIGDIVWYDNNHNGIQDADETGVEGVLIILNETGAKVITNSRGEYKFCNLESGNYSITIDKSTLPDNYI